MRIDQRRPLTAAQQFFNLRANPICAGEGRVHAGQLSWRYETSPSTLSRRYRVRIEFRHGGDPDAFIDDPDLGLLAGHRPLPHVYAQKPTRLCLYLPHRYEWQSWMRIDQSVVPWTALWLFYFEYWLASGEWKGGGEHPRADRRDRHSSSQIRHTEDPISRPPGLCWRY
jgi:hypothetical protein